MPAPSTSSKIISTGSSSGNNLIDSLILGVRWADGLITYSFPDANAYWSTDPIKGYGPNTNPEGEPWSSSFAPLSSSDQTYFNKALQQWANVANIQFKLVPETSSDVGDIRAAYTAIDPGAQAYTYTLQDGYAKSGDIWVGINTTNATEDWIPGTYPFLAIMHEIGHALGLKHPFEGSPTLPVSSDMISETIMSYSAIAGNQNSFLTFYPTTPMPLDILAIQYVYGKNTTYHNGDDNYLFDDSQTYHETIWDSGGVNDTITYAGNQDSTIDLREGMGSKIGNSVFAESTATKNRIPNIWIAYDVTIENAYGGSGNDVIIGNDADNTLNGGGGDDDLDGGEGSDMLWGGNGNDILRAGYGNDVLNGGAGNDTFGFYALGHFQVSDFTRGEDRFFFDAEKIGVSNLNDLISDITNINQKPAGVDIEFGPNASIELIGINFNEITANMVIFAL
jgi:Ca2+-binding RTX toxin-like protein